MFTVCLIVDWRMSVEYVQSLIPWLHMPQLRRVTLLLMRYVESTSPKSNMSIIRYLKFCFATDPHMTMGYAVRYSVAKSARLLVVPKTVHVETREHLNEHLYDICSMPVRQLDYLLVCSLFFMRFDFHNFQFDLLFLIVWQSCQRWRKGYKHWYNEQPVSLYLHQW